VSLARQTGALPFGDVATLLALGANKATNVTCFHLRPGFSSCVIKEFDPVYASSKRAARKHGEPVNAGRSRSTRTAVTGFSMCMKAEMVRKAVSENASAALAERENEYVQVADGTAQSVSIKARVLGVRRRKAV
jgi:hypothetical protein